MLRPIRTVAPQKRILSLEEAKAHLRVDHGDDDDLIEALVLSAESYLDGWAGVLGRCLINQTWQVSYSVFPLLCMDLAFPDVSEVTVTYVDPDGATQTLASSNYELVQSPRNSVLDWTDAFVSPSLKSSQKAVTATIVAGYGEDAASVPAAIIHAAKLMIGTWYEQRESVVAGTSLVELPGNAAAAALLSPFTRTGI